MNTKVQKYLQLVLVLFPLVFVSCDDGGDEPTTSTTSTTQSSVQDGLTFESTGALTIQIDHRYGNDALELSPKSYINTSNDTFRITQLSYYITNVSLTKVNGEVITLNNANLIAFIPPQQSAFVLSNIPAGRYSRIAFNLGVDSIRNSSGLQEGDLDPSYGMFWTWNTGYVFYRCKGRYGSTNNSFSIDIGGSQHLMKIDLSLAAFKKSGTSAKVNMTMNLATMFNGSNPYSLKTDGDDIHTENAPGIPKLKSNLQSSFAITAIE